jgi:hypothetical protein
MGGLGAWAPEIGDRRWEIGKCGNWQKNGGQKKGREWGVMLLI